MLYLQLLVELLGVDEDSVGVVPVESLVPEQVDILVDLEGDPDTIDTICILASSICVNDEGIVFGEQLLCWPLLFHHIEEALREYLIIDYRVAKVMVPLSVLDCHTVEVIMLIFGSDYATLQLESI